MTKIPVGGDQTSTDILVTRMDRVLVEDVVRTSSSSGEETPPRTAVSRVFGGSATTLGLVTMLEESANRGAEASNPPLFIASASS